MPEQQRHFDFDRVGKLRILERLRLPEPPPGSQTTTEMMAAALKAIDSFCGNAASYVIPLDRLVERVYARPAHPRALKRALAQLKREALLIVTRDRSRGRWSANRYQICWANLRDLTVDSGVKITPSHPPIDQGPPPGATRGHHQGPPGAMMAPGHLQLRDITRSLDPPQIFPRRHPVGVAQPARARNTAWQAAAAELRSCGVCQWQDPIDEAHAAGVPAANVREVIRYWRAMRPVWGRGALVARLRRAHAELAPWEGWPTKRGKPRPLVDLEPSLAEYRITVAGQAAGASPETVAHHLAQWRRRASITADNRG